MKALIIEDELIAAQNLQRLIAENTPQVTVTGVLQSVEEAVEYFAQPNETELVFLDIHLADGLAFHIFEQVDIACPIVFTTAYDQYAIEAFKVGGIDYLLKPINPEELKRAVQRAGTRQESPVSIDKSLLATMSEMMQPRRYKSHFLIPVGDRLLPLSVDAIAYIYVNEKMSHAVTFDGQTYVLDRPLDALFLQLDPTQFFRANRQYIIAHQAIKDISLWPLSKLNVTLTVATPEKVIIPRARASEFKDWFTN